MKPGTIVRYKTHKSLIAMITGPREGGGYNAISLVNSGAWKRGVRLGFNKDLMELVEVVFVPLAPGWSRVT